MRRAEVKGMKRKNLRAREKKNKLSRLERWETAGSRVRGEAENDTNKQEKVRWHI